MQGCTVIPIPFSFSDPAPACDGGGHQGGAGYVQACRAEAGCDYLSGQCALIPIKNYADMVHSENQTVRCSTISGVWAFPVGFKHKTSKSKCKQHKGQTAAGVVLPTTAHLEPPGQTGSGVRTTLLCFCY